MQPPFTPVNGTDGKFLYNEVTYGDSGIETGTTIPAAAADLKVESGGYTIRVAEWYIV